MKTTTTQQNNNRFDNGVSVAWLVEAEIDQYTGSALNVLYGSRAITINDGGTAYTYADSLPQKGSISLGMASLRTRGGLASVAGATLRVRNEELLSDLTDSYLIQNDEFRFYMVFVDGAQVYNDRLELFRGVVDTHQNAKNVWTINIKDNSRNQIQPFPSLLSEPIKYPFAYDFGKPVPLAFGLLEDGPHDRSDSDVALMPILMVDKFAIEGVRPFSSSTTGSTYQWYEQANAFAKVNSPSNTGANTGIPAGGSASQSRVGVSSPLRSLTLRPSRPKSGNDQSDWYNTANGETGNNVRLTSSDTLWVYLSTVPKLGEVSSVTLRVYRSNGQGTLNLYNDTTAIGGATTLQGSGDFQDITLTASDFTDWAFALLNVKIVGTQASDADACIISDIELIVGFEDMLAFQNDAPQVFVEGRGFADTATQYRDGSVISGSNVVLRNPVHILQAIMRHKFGLNLPTASIKNGWSATATSRTDWKFDFALTEQVDTTWIEDFCFQAGLHLFPEEGGWSVSAMDKTRTPNALISADWDCPVKGDTGDPSKWDYSIRIKPIPISEAINEVSVSYQKNPASDQYKLVEIASGRSRVTSNDGQVAGGSSGTGILTDSNASFSSDGIVVGEMVYIEGDTSYKVKSVDSNTQITIEPLSGSVVNGTGANINYYIGPNVNGDSIVSQINYKTVATLNGRTPHRMTAFNVSDSTYKSKLIRDTATAKLFVEHLVDWFATPRDEVEIEVFHTHCNLQLGDVIALDHPMLKPSLRAIAKGNTGNSLSTSATSVTVSDSNIFAIGDVLIIKASPADILLGLGTGQPEALVVTGVPSGSAIVVSRGNYNTEAIAHPSGANLFLLKHKFMVMGLSPMTPDNPFVKVKLHEMPHTYLQQGAVEGGNASSGYATFPNGRIVNTNTYSNYSYCGN